MNRLLQTLRDQAPAAWPLWAGAAAAGLAMVLLLGPAAQWQAQADAQLAMPRRAPLPATELAAPPPALHPLPEATRSPERSARLAQLARRQGVQVQRLREQIDEAGQLQLSMSGHAPYAVWRAFVAAALVGDPALALDRLRLQRPAAAAADLDADMQWTFLHRGTASSSARASPRKESAR